MKSNSQYLLITYFTLYILPLSLSLLRVKSANHGHFGIETFWTHTHLHSLLSNTAVLLLKIVDSRCWACGTARLRAVNSIVAFINECHALNQMYVWTTIVWLLLEHVKVRLVSLFFTDHIYTLQNSRKW